MGVDSKIYKGLGVYKFNWVTKNKISIQTSEMSTNYLASSVVIDEDAFKTLKDLYRFRICKGKYVYDFKVGNVIGKRIYTKISDKPMYTLSKQWIKQEIYRTNSPLLKNIIENNVQLLDILPDYKEHLHKKHLEEMKLWKNVADFNNFKGVDDEFDEIE